MQRIAIAEKYRELYEKQAKENMSTGGKAYSPKEGLQNSATLPKEERVNVREKLAKAANVSSEMYRQAKKILDSGDEELKKAVMNQEMSIRQRGDIGGSAKKVGLRINELERLYGIQNGSTHFQGNQHKEVVTNKSEAPTSTQEQLATRMKMSVDSLQNYKLLTEMIPELEELLDTGIVTKTTVLAVMKQRPTSSAPRTTRRKSVKSQRSM